MGTFIFILQFLRMFKYDFRVRTYYLNILTTLTIDFTTLTNEFKILTIFQIYVAPDIHRLYLRRTDQEVGLSVKDSLAAAVEPR